VPEAIETEPTPRTGIWGSVGPYLEKESLAAFALGVSSGFPAAMIGATLATRLSQDGIDKKTVTAFTLATLAYNLKLFWAWIIDGSRIPLLNRMGQRVSWMLVMGLLVIAATVNLALVDPSTDLLGTVVAAVLVGIAGASFDIVIDAYRIETLKPYQLATGSGMAQYGWRIGSAGAGAIALVIAARYGWSSAYIACGMFAVPAIATALLLGEPPRRAVVVGRRGLTDVWTSIAGPFSEFFKRAGAWLVLAFILAHKVGDTLANQSFRLLFNDLKFTNDEIAIYDVGLGFWALLVGVFIGGVAYTRLGLKRSVFIALILMAVSNLSFAALAAAGHSNIGMAGAIGFENVASGYGGVVVVAYFSALCDLRFTASQYAMISAAASVVGRFLTGTTAGALIESIGYVNFYLLTTVVALPGIVLFWWMMRTGLVDAAMGSAGEVGEGDARD
jgi:PAT family beta-lactamase induction signal transducer AmpG